MGIVQEQELNRNKEGCKGSPTFQLHICPRFYGPMSSELRFGASRLQTRTCSNEEGDFLCLPIETSAHKGPIPNRSIHLRTE